MMIHVPETILKRNEYRQEELQKKQDNSPSQAEVFRETFKEKQDEMERSLDAVQRMTDKLELADSFDRISKGINQLNKYLASSSIFLIPYDVKVSKTAIQTLQDRAAELENKLLPKKRFTFKNRKDTKSSSEKRSVPKIVENTAPLNTVNAFVVQDEVSKTVLIRHEDIKNKDVMLCRLKHVTVFMLGSPNTLHIVDVEDCKIISGPVTTSVMVESSVGSAFVFPCQQLRVHNTKSSDFHIHVTTRAIIEDSNKIRFAPYDFSYAGLDAHYVESGLDKDRNNWDDVDDFNWLVSNKKSPNWDVIPDNERLTFSEELRLTSSNLINN